MTMKGHALWLLLTVREAMNTKLGFNNHFI
jgi:hypothetical protein